MRKPRRSDRRREPARAGELIEALLGQDHTGRETREHRVVTEWKSLVGDRISARTSPDRFDNGVLLVRVSNSAWMHQLSFIKQELIDRINQGIGDEPLVRELRFHLGARSREQAHQVRQAHQLQDRPRLRRRSLPTPASGSDLARIEHETAGIEDDELRQIITRARRLLNR